MIADSIFRENDIRGIAGEELARDSALLIGKAFASFVLRSNPQAKRVSVGRDVRLSSKDLASGLIEGITFCGLDVYDVGVCSTPLQYFSLFHLDLDGGIMVTGSHNPPQYNGFKISAGKDIIHGSAIRQLKQIILDGSWREGQKRGACEPYDITAAYAQYMLDEFSYLAEPRFRRVKVVVDAGNGTAGLVVPGILEGIGCEVIPLFCEPDGNFPNHHPDPTVVDYIQDLIAETKRSGADIGVGYDGDADRIGVVNGSGEIVWGDQLVIVLSRELLKECAGAKVIGDVKCSQRMFDDIKKNGGVPIMWKTGHALVKQKMKEEGALLAGEFSGHIFIADRYFGYDDAIYTTLRLVEIMKKTGKNIQQLLADVPAMTGTPEIRHECPDAIKRKVVDSIVSRFVAYKEKGGAPFPVRDVNTLDGVRVLFEKGWGLVRMSNTQPVVVMRAEAVDEETLQGYTMLLESEFRKAMETP
jgi:phosphomannomutase/phosphoglucomutase